ncbi:tetranectin-like [Schistocerca gregaria]|uniref:tetranectin-like n=1 Tax=Schistocerca gregaria TaxID=7010 RepID=UPI00211E7DD2|nr:tetranectin-like [Schistocerca gregaria]
MTWPAAKKTCEDEGAQLAVPPDQYAFNGLRRIFSSVQGIWYANIGVTDQVSEGIFLDIYGRHQRDMEYRVWNPGEPNNYDGGNPENCLALSCRSFYDMRCDLELPFICEIAPM